MTMLRCLCPKSESTTLRAADAICQHIFDLLGSGPVELGSPIDWQLDFKSGHRWNEKTLYLDLHPTPYPGGSDIKVPWELSRCQHFAWLGQAYWFNHDERYAREFRSQVEDWIARNPPQFGVNWVCTMDVAIRTVNWLWGYAYFSDSPSLDDSFHLHFYASLLAHGRHIFNNLEWSNRFTSNHYLSNIVGLVYLGILLPQFKEAKRWREFGLAELEKEMSRQVYSDGVDFEASTNYHRLTTELFLSATLLAERSGHVFSPAYTERLEKMIDAIRLLQRPDGSTPVFGDQDNGRLHRLKIWEPPEQEWVDFRPLLAIGAAWKQRPEWAAAAGPHWEEALWLTGEGAVLAWKLAQHNPVIDRVSEALPEGGWYALRRQNLCMLVEAGSNGQNGNGGHAHNDALSFDLFADGQAWIVDSGTYTYTSDYNEREAFRLTAAHNTIFTHGWEQNSSTPTDPFRMGDQARPRVIRWQCALDHTLWVGEVQRVDNLRMTHRRAIVFDYVDAGWLLADCFQGVQGQIFFPIHFAPGVKTELLKLPFPVLRLTNQQGGRLWVFSLNAILPQMGTSWISAAYGSRQLGATATYEWAGPQTHFLALLSGGDENQLAQRILHLSQTWMDEAAHE
ncbi:MAG: heparinase II/III family protein, partial [Clostridiaceae bacterium]